MNSLDVLKQKGQQALQDNDFVTAAACFEQLLEHQPEATHYHLPLGLAYLLIGQEEAAQLTWAMAFSECEDGDEQSLLQELTTLFQSKIKTFEQQEQWDLAYGLYQHLLEIQPGDVNLILQSIQAALQSQPFSLDVIRNSGLLEALSSTDDVSAILNTTLLESVLDAVLTRDTGSLDILSWVESVARYLPNLEKTIYRFNEKAVQIRQRELYIHDLDLALAYVESGLRLDENYFGLKHERIIIYIKRRDFRTAVLLAEELFIECQNDRKKIRAKSLLIEGLFYIPERWKEAQNELEALLKLLDHFICEYKATEDSSTIQASFLLTSIFFYQYTQDNPRVCRNWQNRLSAFYLDSLARQVASSDQASQFIPNFSRVGDRPNQQKKLRIGFLSEFMTQHSIGWLSRWIFQHYDTSRFEFYTYFHYYTPPSEGLSGFSQTWFAQRATKAFAVYGDAHKVAQKIHDDGINILVDLDSITSDKTYAVMALKPAPVQVTWLGYDASGLPTIDYFLVDPLVLPEQASDYYTEKLWRLPQTYLAVDGFEIGVPTLRRQDLAIPADAVVYFSAQTAVKRHPETISCQLQILKQVPNSYLLLKGVGDSGSLRSSLLQAAAQEGIESDRLRFLELDDDEPTHRANLSIADVVLDTFPYTGATTTMETLWMGIPLVTRVGEQFASRNSYAMLRHAGVNMGIAHSAEEYVEWGVRFGLDLALREQVQEQLWRSRQTSPLWNAKQFTRDLENAFEQMWQQY